jgi:hypothetical protein
LTKERDEKRERVKEAKKVRKTGLGSWALFVLLAIDEVIHHALEE